MNEIERQDSIDRYVKNEMTNEEKEAFEHEMLVDEELKEEVQLDLMIADSIKKQAEKREMMAEWDKDYQKEEMAAAECTPCYMMMPEDNITVAGVEGSKHRKRKKHFWLITSTVGVAVCLAVGVWFTLFDSQPVSLQSPPSDEVGFAKDYVGPVDEDVVDEEDYATSASPEDYYYDEKYIVDRMDITIPANVLSDITEMIDAGKYSDALDWTDKYLDKRLMASGEYAKMLDNSDLYELLWLRIKSLDGLGRTDDALLILKSFVNKEGKHQKEAYEILKRLEKGNIQKKLSPEELKRTLEK